MRSFSAQGFSWFAGDLEGRKRLLIYCEVWQRILFRSEARGSSHSMAVLQHAKTTDEIVEEDGSSRALNPGAMACGRRSQVARTLLSCVVVESNLRRINFAVVRGSIQSDLRRINFAVVVGSRVGLETRKLCCWAWQ